MHLLLWRRTRVRLASEGAREGRRAAAGGAGPYRAPAPRCDTRRSDFDRTLTSSESRRPFPTLAEQARDGYGPGAGSDAGAGTDRHTLSDFHRNARNRIEHLRKTGRPEILTVDGRAELVVQHAEAYQRLLDLVANAGAIIGTERGLQGMYEGTGEDADEAFAALERELGLPERE
jgi:hypothetical protein